MNNMLSISEYAKIIQKVPDFATTTHFNILDLEEYDFSVYDKIKDEEEYKLIADVNLFTNVCTYGGRNVFIYKSMKNEIKYGKEKYHYIYSCYAWGDWKINETRKKMETIINQKTNVIKITDGEFTFEYGIVTFEHRFYLNSSSNDYKETTLNRCIRIGLVFKYYTMACDKLIPELQIVYKDENNKLQCLKKDLHEWTFKIVHKGDMQIQI